MLWRSCFGFVGFAARIGGENDREAIWADIQAQFVGFVDERA
jgi:hypothetical protein